VLSRTTGLQLNNVVLVGLAVCVLLGTLFPLLVEVTTGQQASVGPPFFDRVAVPSALMLLLLMAVAPVARWRRDEPGALAGRVLLPASVGALTVAVLGLAGARGVVPVVTLGLAAAVATTALRQLAAPVLSRFSSSGALKRSSMPRFSRSGAWKRSFVPRFSRSGGTGSRLRRRALGGHVAHLGLAVALAGVAASSAWSTAGQVVLRSGESARVAGADVRLDRVSTRTTPGRLTTAADLTTTRGDSARRASPSVVVFSGRDMSVSRPSIWSRVTGDLYLSVLDVADDGSTVTLRVVHEPLVGWIWVGGALMVLGGVLAAVPTGRRHPGRDPEPRDVVVLAEPDNRLRQPAILRDVAHPAGSPTSVQP
jgi:cytochrome c-type biogenesis protein CcmF